jgi:hypothetical protein
LAPSRRLPPLLPQPPGCPPLPPCGGRRHRRHRSPLPGARLGAGSSAVVATPASLLQRGPPARRPTCSPCCLKARSTAATRARSSAPPSATSSAANVLVPPSFTYASRPERLKGPAAAAGPPSAVASCACSAATSEWVCHARMGTVRERLMCGGNAPGGWAAAAAAAPGCAPCPACSCGSSACALGRWRLTCS